MTAAQNTLSVSTEQLPPNERVPYWREVFGRTIVKLDIEPLGDGPFFCDATLRALPALSVAGMTTSASRVSRTRTLIADGSDDLLLSMTRKGTALVSYRGRDVPIAEGGAILCHSADSGSLAFRSQAQFTVLAIPAGVLLPMIGDRDAALVRPISPDTGALRLLGGYVDLLLQQPLEASEVQRKAAAYVRDVVALAVGATRDAAHLARGRGARAARLAAIRADVLANLSQVRLSPRMIARRHQVTERYVHLLFADTDQTFGEFVTAARLDRARELLNEAPHPKIADIAHRVGYGEMTTFNRAFRRRFGRTPSDLRAEAAPEP
jgi:AraC-like DNA-binding protein